MKELNEEIDVLNNEKELKDFDTEVSVIAKYGMTGKEDLIRHAKINGGFHDYEEDSFADKKMISNLCDIYKVFFEDDPKFKSFLNKMKEYAELDPYTHDNYIKEKNFVQSVPGLLMELNEALDVQEQKFQEEIRDIDEEKYNNLSAEEKRKFDRKYTIRQETIDNRRRALANFDMYFDHMTKGELNDMDDLKGFVYEEPQSEEHKKMGLKKTKVDFDFQMAHYTTDKNNRKCTTFKNRTGEQCYYIDAAGVPLDLEIKGDGLTNLQKALAGIANKVVKEELVKDAPIFPHEPRMTDVSQHYSGECYLYAGLQNVARLYPEKIKKMIKDNGDGTATVKLWGKKLNKNTGKTEFRPVYVRVDKKLSKFGTLNMEYERLGEDCLWVNLIERAYAMSGLHESYDQETNLPLDGLELKDKDWKPAVHRIEGGNEQLFLENLLGPDGVKTKVVKPDYSKVKEEREALEGALDKLQTIKDMDANDPESILRHAFYKIYAEKNNDLTEKQFQELPENKFISKVDSLFTKEGLDFLDFETAYKALKYTVENVLKEVPPGKRTEILLTNKLGAARDNGISKALEEDKDRIPENRTDELTRTITAVYDKIRPGIMDIKLKDEIPEREKTETFFKDIQESIDKGYIVSASTYGDKSRTKIADYMHAYSIIGAFKSEDVPPKYYFRIKNPHTKLTSNNGVEYVNENGKVVGKWVNVKDGIFDMEVEDFVHDFENVHYNGSDELVMQTHKTTAGYDIISPEQIEHDAKTRVSSDNLTDYIKCANDLYDALICTNSRYSNDSEQYKDLSEGLKQFRHQLAGAQGKTFESMKELTQPLIKLVEAYEKHVDDKLLGPSKRQTRRKNICQDIRNVANAIEEGRNPHQEYEKEYAKTLLNKYYDMKNLKDKSKLDEVTERLYNNKAFRGIANNTNIVSMKKPAKGQLEGDLNKIETSLKGRGVDKGIDLATMKPKKSAAPTM